MKRLLVMTIVGCVSLMLGGVAGAATATTDLDEVAAALRENPVYVDARAERAFADDEGDELRAAIRSANTPVYIAVLPASAADGAGGDPDEVARQLADAVGRPGTFGVVVGDSFRAGSSELPAGRAGELAAASLATSDDTLAVLSDFVERVSEAAASDASVGSGESPDNGADDGSNLWLPALLAAGVGWWFWRRTRRRRAEAAERARAEEADRQMLKAELAVLTDDVLRLEPEVRLHPEAQSDFDAAFNRYRAAQAALDYADEPVDLVRLARVVAEARYAMDRVRAMLEGREPPPPPPELAQVGPHGEPAITLDERHQPAYVGYPGGFQGGWFGGVGGGLFSGLLLGSMLGGGFGGWGGGGTTIINQGGDGGGGGDWGGGWGGDFGGGDFGGGDFGGGDFGGGDF